MDGYTIKEAASVLGVPKKRVWELIARGVLAGSAEDGGSMRVFLNPRPADEPPGQRSPAAAEAQPVRRAAEPAPPAAEVSPFRELLTEFRNLTERYGQALLALGEARGEVAALRSRVDLLEARMDLRLPAPREEVPPVAWERPAPAAAAAEVAPATQVETAVEPPATDEAQRGDAGRRRRRGRSGTSAVAGLAAALARADDPTLAELPGAREAAEALAALRERPEVAEPAAGEPGEEPAAGEPGEEPAVFEPTATIQFDQELPVEAAPAIEPLVAEEEEPPAVAAVTPPVAEAEPAPPTAPPRVVDESVDLIAVEPVAEPAEPTPIVAYRSIVEEPDWISEEDLLAPNRASVEPAPPAVEPAPPAVEPAPPAVEPPAQAEAWLEVESIGFPAKAPIEPPIEPAPPAKPEPIAQLEPARLAEPAAEPEAEPAAPFVAEDDVGEGPAPEIAEQELIATHPDEEALMWLGAEPDADEAADEMEMAASGWRAAATGAPWGHEPEGLPELDIEPIAAPEAANLPEDAHPADADDDAEATPAEEIGDEIGGGQVGRREIDDALAALESLASTPPSAWGAGESAWPAADVGLPEAAPEPNHDLPAEEPPAVEAAGPELPSEPLPAAPLPGTPERPTAPDPRDLFRQRTQAEEDWLRVPRSPAARAYRRLRRIFPG